MRLIKEGDTVTLCMARGGCFDFQVGAEIYRVTVLHVPEATGALWYFRTAGEDGVEFAVNPYSSDFVGLILSSLANSDESEVGDDYCSHPCPGCEAILAASRECPAIGDDGADDSTPPPPTRWMDWPGRARIIGG